MVIFEGPDPPTPKLVNVLRHNCIMTRVVQVVEMISSGDVIAHASPPSLPSLVTVADS